MSREQQRMMNDDNKLSHESSNPMTKLFRELLKELNYRPDAWNRRLTRFLNSAYSRVPKNAKDIGQERNNFNRAISRKAMTWKTFQKAIQIMGPTRYKITIDMEWSSGARTTVDTGFIKNPLAEIDTLSNQKTAAELSPETFDGEHDEQDED